MAAQTAVCLEAWMLTAMLTGFRDRLTLLPEKGEYERKCKLLHYLVIIWFRALLECSGYEIGAPPFTVTLFHDGSDGLTLDWVEV